MKNRGKIALLILSSAVAWLAWEAGQLREMIRTGQPPAPIEARESARLAAKICDPCAAAATTTYPGREVNGGYTIFQVTCSTAGGNTWPDAFDLEARDADDHTWVAVQGYTTATADAREFNLLGFAESSQVRAVITDSAGQHSCFATLSSFGGMR